jgi:tripartite-type tricarboxylate transporter receptor subunit TctC
MHRTKSGVPRRATISHSAQARDHVSDTRAILFKHHHVSIAATHAQNQWVYKKPLYNALTDFEPVILIVDQSLVLVARRDFPTSNLHEFIAYAKADPWKLRYGSAGIGGSNHLACVLFNSAAGIDASHIPYRSGAQAMQDLLGARLTTSVRAFRRRCRKSPPTL